MGGVIELVQSGPLLLAMPVAAAAGAVTFLSPCVLPLVPGYLSYITGMSGTGIQAAPTTQGSTAAMAGAAVASTGARPGAGIAQSAGGAGIAQSAGGAGIAQSAGGAGIAGPAGDAVTAAGPASAPRPVLQAAQVPGRGRAVAGTALFVL